MTPLINSLLLLLFLYVVWRIFIAINYYFGEYYTLWNIARAGKSRRNVSTKLRLYMYVCKTDLLDECSITELYRFLMTMMKADTTVQEFHKLALSYTYAVLYRERNSGSLRGVMFAGIDRKMQDDHSPYTVIRIGLSFFQLDYRGGPYMYSFATYLFLKELIMHPLTPLYILGKAFSYKSYCVIAHSLRYSYPRYDHETPDFLRDIINQYGHKVKLPNEEYEEDTFVLKRERVSMKNYVAILDKEGLRDPHIKFFVEINPGWEKGHQLITIGHVKWTDVFWIFLKTLSKAIQGKGKRSKTGRRITFQLESSNKYLGDIREMDAICYYHPGDLEDIEDLEDLGNLDNLEDLEDLED